MVKTFSDLDRKFGYTYPKTTTVTTPAGLVMNASILKDYIDADGNGIPEQVSEQRTVNGKSASMVQDVAQSRLSVTTPAGRTSTTTYNPATLRPLTSQTPGLFTTSYLYYPDGRIQSVVMGGSECDLDL